MKVYYAWNTYTDEIKMFRFESARDSFVVSDDDCDWRAITEEDLTP